MSSNLTFQLAYTFSKALGTADSIYNNSAIPGEIRQANYGRLAYDKTHILVVQYFLYLPQTDPWKQPGAEQFRDPDHFQRLAGLRRNHPAVGSPYGLG